MWPLEVIKHMNKKKDKLPLSSCLAKRLSDLNFNQYSFKILSEPIQYNSISYNYIVPNNEVGKQIIKQILVDPDQALYIKQLDVYLL